MRTALNPTLIYRIVTSVTPESSPDLLGRYIGSPHGVIRGNLCRRFPDPSIPTLIYRGDTSVAHSADRRKLQNSPDLSGRYIGSPRCKPWESIRGDTSISHGLNRGKSVTPYPLNTANTSTVSPASKPAQRALRLRGKEGEPSLLARKLGKFLHRGIAQECGAQGGGEGEIFVERHTALISPPLQASQPEGL